MPSDKFEKIFGDYLASKEYDDAADSLFSIIRTAFLAGWKAACGEVPEAQHNIIHLLYKQEADPE